MERLKIYQKRSIKKYLASVGLGALLLGAFLNDKVMVDEDDYSLSEFFVSTNCDQDNITLEVATEGIPLKAYQTAEVKLEDLLQTPPKTAILAYYHLDSPDDGSYYRIGGTAMVRDRAVAFGGYDEIILQQGQIYRVSVDRYQLDKRSTAERIAEMDFSSCTSEAT